MYDSGNLPSDFNKSVIVTMPKKAGADRCDDYKTISLLSHASTILTRIIYRRPERAIEYQLNEDQFGFRKNRGTREAVLALRIIIEDRIKKNKKPYIAFIDLEKAFDNMDWNKMFSVLRNAEKKKSIY